MAVKLGVLALLEAKPGMGNDLAAFLQAGRDLAAAEDVRPRSARWPTISLPHPRTFAPSTSSR
jgi:hypothetical protein